MVYLDGDVSPVFIAEAVGAICDCGLIKAFWVILENGHKSFPPRASACSWYSDFLCVVFPHLFYLTLHSEEY